MDIAERSELCSGCGACKSVCPINAIEMVRDEKGFLYPIVNETLCINCGKCKKVCPTNRKDKEHIGKLKSEIYAVQIKEKSKRNESQSGGAFTAFAERVLCIGGVVYGVSLNENLQAVYTRIDNKDSLNKLKGSKYVQADTGSVFKEVALDLKSGIFVMFSGTACHVDGLISYLDDNKISKKNLLTCDIICHGTNSPRIYNDYLKFIKMKYDFDKGKGFNFRDKAKGWHDHVESFYNSKGKKIFQYGYVNLFYTNLGLRDSCYNCPYANMNRISDITLGDFWGIEKLKPEYDDNTGVSLVLLNSEKAKLFFDLIKSIEFFRVDIKDCMQHNMKEPTIMPDNISMFWDDYNRREFTYILKKYGKSSIKKVFIRNIINFMEFFGIKEIVKKVIRWN